MSPLTNGAGEVKVFVVWKEEARGAGIAPKSGREFRKAMGGLQVNLVGRKSSFRFNITFRAGSTLF
jgi:hypothetical protein